MPRSGLDGERMEAASQRVLARPDWMMGDQDWFTLLAWTSPLVLLLPCQYNFMGCRAVWSSLQGSQPHPNTPCSHPPAITHHCGNPAG